MIRMTNVTTIKDYVVSIFNSDAMPNSRIEESSLIISQRPGDGLMDSLQVIKKCANWTQLNPTEPNLDPTQPT